MGARPQAVGTSAHRLGASAQAGGGRVAVLVAAVESSPALGSIAKGGSISRVTLGRQRMKAAKLLLRRAAVALAGLALSFMMLSGLARANGRYFYCEAMGLMATDPCAPAAQETRPVSGSMAAREARESHADCCEVVTLPSLPDATNVSSPAVSPPALVAVLPAEPAPDAQLRVPRAWSDRAFEHGRAPRRSAAQARAQLMVFLT